MLKIGTHLSSSKGLEMACKDAISIGANTFQVFLRNPRGLSTKPIDLNDFSNLRSLMFENNFSKVIVHAPYTLNACSNKEHVRDLAKRILKEDLEKMEHIPGNYYNIHPGNHLGQGEKIGIGYIVDMLNDVLRENQSTIVLLETMSGKGSEVGKDFREIQSIIKNTDLNNKLGVCFDACHLSDSGYDIKGNLEGVLNEFDRIVGLNRLCAFHLNDSMNQLGSRKDRHTLIGEGFIGLDTIINIINHPKLRSLPFILETPTDLGGHLLEIKLLKSLYKY